jgi:MOSC domain-containing protein YiiM
VSSAVGVVLSVNVGAVAPFRAGRATTRAIVKTPVSGPIAVRGVNLEGDDQADRRVHGGPEQAVYAYARESYEWWEDELGRDLAPGTFGENLTLEGVEVDGALVGERWAIGTAVLEVRAPRVPCQKLATRMGDPKFVKRFARGRRPGAYLAIVQEGALQAGDRVEVVLRPDHDVTVSLVFEAELHDHALAPRLLAAPELPGALREWALSRA